MIMAIGNYEATQAVAGKNLGLDGNRKHHLHDTGAMFNPEAWYFFSSSGNCLKDKCKAWKNFHSFGRISFQSPKSKMQFLYRVINSLEKRWHKKDRIWCDIS